MEFISKEFVLNLIMNYTELKNSVSVRKYNLWVIILDITIALLQFFYYKSENNVNRALLNLFFFYLNFQDKISWQIAQCSIFEIWLKIGLNPVSSTTLVENRKCDQINTSSETFYCNPARGVYIYPVSFQPRSLQIFSSMFASLSK